MTSIMKYRTKFSGACQCHRMLMSSSGSVAPISVYIYNIHIYYMYVFDIYVEMIYSCITIKHQGFCITQRNSAFWYESIMAVLFTLYSCPCILMSVKVFETNFFIVILFLPCAVGHAFIRSQRYAQGLLHPSMQLQLVLYLYITYLLDNKYRILCIKCM